MTDGTIPQLAGERFVSVQTFRRSGQGISTPVWFAEVGDGFVFGTHADSGKVKRIRNNPKVRFAAANYRGLERSEYADATAVILEAEAAEAADAVLGEKYGWQWFPFSRLIDCFVRVTPD
ncbi:MAG: PPOX class F420-dependent oxidoreductase [Acidimicrobiia bacterium]